MGGIDAGCDGVALGQEFAGDACGMQSAGGGGQPDAIVYERRLSFRLAEIFATVEKGHSGMPDCYGEWKHIV